jgi:3',5'-cyclic AMP phosphodiesterase CpdA
LRRIAHLSDLHFGRHDPVIAESLIEDLRRSRPDLVVISGDLTQRARRSEFIAARDFLARLSAPTIAVPGNHDVPLYNVIRRTFRPLTRFARYITAAEQPFFADAEIAVLGLNTARSLAVANGRISRAQMAAILAAFRDVASTSLRALVTHHPLLPAPHAPERSVVGRAESALSAIAEAGVELFLTGHHHRSFTGELIDQPLTARRSILVSEAGTAISTRRRAEANSYNVITIDGREVGYERRAWSGEGFAGAQTQCYVHEGQRWVRLR